MGCAGSISASNLMSTKFLKTVVTALSILCSVSGILDVTLVIDNPIAAYNQNVSIKCVGEESYFAGFPFTIDADIGTGSNVTEDHLYGSIEPEPWPGKQLTLLDTSGPLKYGYYSCTAMDDETKEISKVTGLIMSKNGLVFPTSFTYQATKGESVTMGMVQARRRRFNDLFWFRFTKSGIPKKAAQGRLRVTIAKPTETGAYVAFYPTRDKYVRIFQQGMTRLLVRDCESGKYGIDCEFDCPPCENGAVCDDKNGTCICPPGFMGSLCEIGCGPNKFGASCQYSCSNATEEVKGCEEKLFCLPDPYGCTCATGYTGIICSYECPDGTYGHACKLPCHCIGNKCDRFTGNCTEGCSEGWTGINCQKQCENGTYGPNCNESCGQCSDSGFCDRFSGHCSEMQMSVNTTMVLNVSISANATSYCRFGYQPPLCKETCQTGSWGLDCLKECHCYNNVSCEADTGFCPVTNKDEDFCDSGWQGKACNETCEDGFYGARCLNECGHCVNQSACHHITGDCEVNIGQCEPGYVKSKCVDPCGDGYFGIDCSNPCNCANGTTCHPIHGTCVGFCQAGWTGSNCLEPCPYGTFGLNCTKKCGHCKPVDDGPLCDQTFGKCTNGCTKAWAGDLCLRGILCDQSLCFNEGSCQQSGDLYTCHCTPPYSGANCEVLDPPCLSGPCLNNGTCTEVTATDFKCNCTHNFTGKQCEKKTEDENVKTDDDDKSEATNDGSKSGVAAAIVITCLAVLGLAAAGIYLFFKHKNSFASVSPATTKSKAFPSQIHNKPSDNLPMQNTHDANKNIVKNAKEDGNENTTEEELDETNSEDTDKEQYDGEQANQNFPDKHLPVTKDTTAHVSPINHENNNVKQDADENEESTELSRSSTATQDKLSVFTSPENDDFLRVGNFAPQQKELFPKPPTPPKIPGKPTAKPITLSRESGNRKVSRRSKQLKFSKSTLERLSEISMHNFYNNNASGKSDPKEKTFPNAQEKVAQKTSQISCAGNALDPWDTKSHEKPLRGQVVYGVSRRDSTLLITSPRDADEEFEMESRKGSFVDRGNLGRSLYLTAT